MLVINSIKIVKLECAVDGAPSQIPTLKFLTYPAPPSAPPSQIILLNLHGVKTHTQLSKKEGKDQESIQSSTEPDPGCQWESSDNVTISHHRRESGGQPFPSR